PMVVLAKPCWRGRKVPAPPAAPGPTSPNALTANRALTTSRPDRHVATPRPPGRAPVVPRHLPTVAPVPAPVAPRAVDTGPRMSDGTSPDLPPASVSASASGSTSERSA